MMEPFPYAPHRARPLSLLNPLDYGVLLYWVFFFPQALRWYVERFGRLPATAPGRDALRQDPVQRRLAAQAVVLLAAMSTMLVLEARALGVELDPFGVAVGVAFGVAVGVAVGVGGGAGICRLDLFGLALVPGWLQDSKRLAVLIQRASPLPIPGLTAQVSARLAADWDAGLRLCEGLLRYTLQFIPVIRALDQALARTDPSQLLARIAAWCDLGPHDWRVVFYQSASPRAGLVSDFWDGFFLLPRRWRPQVQASPRYDTPARAACAAFWHLHEGRPRLAEQAFAHVRDLPHGAELHANAAALAAAAECTALDQIGDWRPPAPPGTEPLRPGVHTVLETLGQVASDVHLVQHSHSIRERSSALNRATGALKALQGRLDACPPPERGVVEEVVRRWLDLVLGVASDVGTLIAREPVTSPYIVGAPVPAHRLVGREAVLDQLRAAWAKPGQRDSLVVYGHRRMGKTSVLRNVLAIGGLGEDTGLAYLNLQTVDWAESLADLCHAIAFALWQATPRGSEGPEAASYQDHPLAALRDFMARLGNDGRARRYILVLDEYELLDSALPGEAGSQFITLLRGLTQQYPWLVVALVGLHDLKERSASLYQPIYAWRPVRVSFLDAGGVADVLQVEDDAFPLAYSPGAIARIHALTGGQPFLVQLLGDSLVQRFNQRLRAELRPPPATLDEEDVAAVVAAQALYAHGAVYFRGIWEQAALAPPGQQALLRALAAHAQGLDAEHLQRATGLAWDAQAAALEVLQDHDVVTLMDGRYRFTVELMRRWVAADMMDRGAVDAVARGG